MITIQTENSIAYAVAIEVASAARRLRQGRAEMAQEMETMGFLLDAGVLPHPGPTNRAAEKIAQSIAKLHSLRAVAEVSGLDESAFDALVAVKDAKPTFNA